MLHVIIICLLKLSLWTLFNNLIFKFHFIIYAYTHILFYLLSQHKLRFMGVLQYW